MQESVLIIGAGSGLSASLARLCKSKGMKIVLAARDIVKLKKLKKEINAETIKCDATNIKSVSSLFKKTDQIIGTPNLVIYNPSKSLGGSIADIDPKRHMRR
jgi:short-subunit dehydrogenase